MGDLRGGIRAMAQSRNESRPNRKGKHESGPKCEYCVDVGFKVKVKVKGMSSEVISRGVSLSLVRKVSACTPTCRTATM